jgi:hypothetical protein
MLASERHAVMIWIKWPASRCRAALDLRQYLAIANA